MIDKRVIGEGSCPELDTSGISNLNVRSEELGKCLIGYSMKVYREGLVKERLESLPFDVRDYVKGLEQAVDIYRSECDRLIKENIELKEKLSNLEIEAVNDHELIMQLLEQCDPHKAKCREYPPEVVVLIEFLVDQKANNTIKGGFTVAWEALRLWDSVRGTFNDS